MSVEKLDRYADYCPVLSSFTNAIQLGYKGWHYVASKASDLGVKILKTQQNEASSWKAHSSLLSLMKQDVSDQTLDACGDELEKMHQVLYRLKYLQRIIEDKKEKQVI